jgi:hypothetical protein
LRRSSINDRWRVCGIGSIFSEPAHRDGSYARSLVDRLLDQAARDRAAMALLFLMVRSLVSTVVQPRLSGDDVLYWRSDIFWLADPWGVSRSRHQKHERDNAGKHSASRRRTPPHMWLVSHRSILNIGACDAMTP